MIQCYLFSDEYTPEVEPMVCAERIRAIVETHCEKFNLAADCDIHWLPGCRWPVHCRVVEYE